MSTPSFMRTLTSFFVLLSVIFSALTAVPVEELNKTQVKNVIFMIGDGMGENHLEKTKQATGKELVMETLPLRGQSETASASSAVTDSAAGGTALACGVRTINGCIGVYNTDFTGAFSHPQNLCEAAMGIGKKVGVVTTDSTSGATPASFSAHTSSRSNEKDISEQQLCAGYDLIWGAPSDSVTAEGAQANGLTFVSSLSEMNALSAGSKSFGQFSGDLYKAENPTDDQPVLSEMTAKAIELLDNEDEGFFLMVEGAHIDKRSHSNDAEGMQEALLEFDKAIATALEFAEQDGETLIIITADHETGGIKKNSDGIYDFTQGSHSGANVPLIIYGSSDFIKDAQAIQNKQVAIYAARSMGLTPEQFPKKIAA
ncbi:MAG: alkaline phosphatase [Clostridiales bacterium]|nr:alkaline phosphatase [Clostridiales bacterium]